MGVFKKNNTVCNLYKDGKLQEGILSPTIDELNKPIIHMEVGTWNLKTGLAQDTTQYYNVDNFCRGLEFISVTSPLSVNVSVGNFDWLLRCYDDSNNVTGTFNSDSTELPTNTTKVKLILNKGKDTVVNVRNDIKNFYITFNNKQYRIYPNKVFPTDFTIASENGSNDVGVNQELKLVPTFITDGDKKITETKLYWVSENSSIATVNDGVVTGILEGGSTNIKCYSFYNVNLLKTFNVNIKHVYGEITNAIYQMSINEGKNATIPLCLNIEPTSAQDVTLSCDNANAIITPNKLTFDKTNYSTNQCFYVHIKDDSKKEDYQINLTLSSTNVDNVVIPITVKKSVTALTDVIQDSLVFEIDGSSTVTNNVLYDNVNNKACEFVGAKKNGKIYCTDGSTVSTRNRVVLKDLTGLVDLQNNGCTLEFVYDRSVNEDIFSITATDSASWQKVRKRVHNEYVNGNFVGLSSVDSGYISTSNTEVPEYNANTCKTLFTKLNVSFNANNLCYLTFVIYPYNNTIKHEVYLNKVKILSQTRPSDFSKYMDDSLKYIYLFVDNKNFNSFRLYNKVLSDDEKTHNYNYIIQNPTLGYLAKYPNSIKCENGMTNVQYNIFTPLGCNEKSDVSIEDNTYADVSFPQKDRILITGKKHGNTNIKINTDGVENTIPVEVCTTTKRPPIEYRHNQATSVVFTNELKTMRVGDWWGLHAMLLPWKPLEDDNLVKFTSSNESVAVIDYGVLHALSVGNTTITVSNLDGTITNSYELQVIAKSEKKYTNIYTVPNDYEGLYIDNTHPFETTNTIKTILNYAKTNNYDKVIFPKGDYCVTGDCIVEESDSHNILFKIPNNVTIDFQGSNMQVIPCKYTYAIKPYEYHSLMNPHGSPAYCIFAFTDGISNSILQNLNLYGERYLCATDGMTPPYQNWNGMLVAFEHCYECYLENCIIENGISWGIATNISGDNSKIKNAVIYKDKAEFGSINDNGLTIDGNGYRTSDYIACNNWSGKYYQLTQGDVYNAFYPYVTCRLYDVFWYDENKTFISVDKNRHYHYVYETRPENAKYFKIWWEFQDKAPSYDTKFWGDNRFSVMHNITNRSHKCVINNCVMKNNGSFGIGRTMGWSLRVFNSHFIDNGQRMYWLDLDNEDGFASNNSDVFVGNHFTRRVLLCAGANHVFVGNLFTHCSINADANCEYNRYIRNTFIGGGISANTHGDAIMAENYLHNGATCLYRGDKPGKHDMSYYGIRSINNYGQTLVTSLTIDKTASVGIGEYIYLNTSYSPNNATSKKCYWISSNTSIATIDKNTGKITGVALGNCTIRAISVDGSNIIKDCALTVVNSVALESLTLTSDVTPSALKDVITLTTKYTPSNTTQRYVKYSSNNTDVATVDSNGKVTFVGYGDVTITVTSEYNSNINATCSFTLVKPDETTKFNGTYIQWLTGDKASYIDTNIIPNDDSVIEFKCKCNGNNQDYIFGNKNNETVLQTNYGGYVCRFGGTNISLSRPSGFSSKNDIAECYISKTFTKLNNHAGTTVTGGSKNTSSILLFAQRLTSGVPSNFSNASINYFKISNTSGEILFNAKACLDNNGVPCMYDDVSHKYLYNSGTGTFTYTE